MLSYFYNINVPLKKKKKVNDNRNGCQKTLSSLVLPYLLRSWGICKWYAHNLFHWEEQRGEITIFFLVCVFLERLHFKSKQSCVLFRVGALYEEEKMKPTRSLNCQVFPE